MKSSQVTKQCLVCEKSFKVRKYREHTAKYCSEICHKNLRFQNVRVTYTCVGCKKEFIDSPSRSGRKFCSTNCRANTRLLDTERRKNQKAAQVLSRGNNSSRRLRNWIFRVKEAKCQSCGYDKRKYCIELHHIDNNPNNNNIDNIAILCVICHRELHQGDLENAVEEGFLPKNNIIEYKRA